MAKAEPLGSTVAARWQEWTDHAPRSGRGWSAGHARNMAYAFREMVGPTVQHMPLCATTREQWAEMLIFALASVAPERCTFSTAR